MLLLIAGLAIFFGVHSLRIFAEDWRGAQIARLGVGAYKGVYSLLSLLGLALITIGYAQARAAPVTLWDPPLWTRHLSALLVLFAFVLLVAAYVPRSRIRAAVGHPMTIGVKIWAAGHLLANGTLADLLLFGSFLLWAVFDLRAARARDRRHGRVGVRASLLADVATIVVGVVLWAAFALYLHGWLFGVRPFVA
ncbi:MAG: NnrU family protein [Burkholderiales bacterium]|jgi:uncharacterized membrane protein|nr:NnrU family protein [Burkholderiales bacterium]